MRKLRVHTIQFFKSEQVYGYGHAERIKSRVITETFLFDFVVVLIILNITISAISLSQTKQDNPILTLNVDYNVKLLAYEDNAASAPKTHPAVWSDHLLRWSRLLHVTAY